MNKRLRHIYQEVIESIVATKGGAKLFWEAAADSVAEQWRQPQKLAPDELGRLKRFIMDCPPLARRLMRHWPKAEWLKDVANLRVEWLDE